MSLHGSASIELLPVVPPQPAPVVQRFTDRDPVKPRLQRTATAESANSAKRLQKYVCVMSAASQESEIIPDNNAVDRP